MSTCNRVDLQALGSQPMINYAQKSPRSLDWTWINIKTEIDFDDYHTEILLLCVMI